MPRRILIGLNWNALKKLEAARALGIEVNPDLEDYEITNNV